MQTRKINKLTISLVLLAVMIVSVPVSNAEMDDWGPDVGTLLPIELQHLDQHGASQSFEALVGPQGIVLFFIRSLDWCQFCKQQMIELNERMADFQALGVNVVSISYDSVNILDAFSTEYGVSFRMLSDTDSEIINAFGIRNEMYQPGESGYGIPDPGVFVIDTGGVITAKFFEKSYEDRPQLDDVLAAVERL
jgi:peroxiredoxin